MPGIYHKKLIKRVSERISIPTGGIILWYGTDSTVPTGFEIYTTLNGNFILGASTPSLTQSGSSSHTHSYSSTAVSWNTGHTHTVTADSVGGATNGLYGFGSDTAASSSHTHPLTGSVVSNGAHRHTIGDTGSTSITPPHMKLYYIRRV